MYTGYTYSSQSTQNEIRLQHFPTSPSHTLCTSSSHNRLRNDNWCAENCKRKRERETEKEVKVDNIECQAWQNTHTKLSLIMRLGVLSWCRAWKLGKLVYNTHTRGKTWTGKNINYPTSKAQLELGSYKFQFSIDYFYCSKKCCW